MPENKTKIAGPFWIEEIPGTAIRQRLGVTESFLESLAPGESSLTIVGLELAAEGMRLAAGDALGMLHLPDRAVTLRAPFALTVATRNEAALADPRLAAVSPRLRGWLIETAGGNMEAV